MIDSMITWLSSTAIHDLVIGYRWAWTIMEIIHFAGLCLLLGGLLIIDLSLMGVLDSQSLGATHRLLTLVIFGFVINLVTGILFVFGDPGRYLINISFQLKVLFLILAGINALWYTKIIAPKLAGQHQFSATSETKLAGALSLIFWFAVLVFGRLIPYIGTG